MTSHPSAAQARPSLDVVFPIPAPEVMPLAVTLDRDLQLRVREIDPRHKIAGVVVDGNLPVCRRKGSAPKELQEVALEWTAGRWATHLPRVEQGSELSRARSPASTEAVQKISKRTLGDQPSAPCLIENKLQSLRIEAACKIEDRPECVGYSHVLQPPEIAIVQFTHPVNGDSVAGALERANRGRHLDREGLMVDQSHQRRRREVG
jgi:hypothetical protein